MEENLKQNHKMSLSLIEPKLFAKDSEEYNHIFLYVFRYINKIIQE
jgi:hypothetical protein